MANLGAADAQGQRSGELVQLLPEFWVINGGRERQTATGN
jgi:hypothetical protein